MISILREEHMIPVEINTTPNHIAVSVGRGVFFGVVAVAEEETAVVGGVAVGIWFPAWHAACGDFGAGESDGDEDAAGEKVVEVSGDL